MMHTASVIQGAPWYPEHDLTLRLTELLQDRNQLGALLEHWLQGGDDLINCLQELLLVRIPALDLVENCLPPYTLPD